MCLAVPGRVVQWQETASPFLQAAVEFEGIRRIVSMECVPEATVGDYVLVHAGLAISRIDPREAERMLATLRELDGMEADADVGAPPPEDCSGELPA